MIAVCLVFGSQECIVDWPTKENHAFTYISSKCCKHFGTVKKRTRGQLSAESKLNNWTYKLVRVQSASNFRRTIDWNRSNAQLEQKRESVVGNVSMATHMFSVVNVSPGFVSIKIEAILKVIMNIWRCFKCLKPSWYYSKLAIETLEQGVKYVQN